MATANKNGYWLFKQEPSCYSYGDLERDGQTTWDGVTNSLALQHLRQVRSGDRVLFYHTGTEKAVVGEMVVLGDPRATEYEGRPSVEVEVAPVRRLTGVSLALIKADPLLQKWDLVRLPRLSVVPVSEDQWRRIEELSASLQSPSPARGKGSKRPARR